MNTTLLFRDQLEGTARYAGLLLAPAEGFDRLCPSSGLTNPVPPP